MTRISRAARRAIDRHGIDITHRYFTKQSDSEYGEEYDSGTTETITARIDRSSSGSDFERDPRESRIQGRRLIHVKDSVSNIVDGGDDGASEFDFHGETYVCMMKDDLGNGTYRLALERKG